MTTRVVVVTVGLVVRLALLFSLFFFFFFSFFFFFFFFFSSFFSAKSSVQVAFHAKLSKTVSTSDSITLVCDEVISNAGGRLRQEDRCVHRPNVRHLLLPGHVRSLSVMIPAFKTVLHIVLDDETIGCLGAHGKGKCTAHVAVEVNAGQKVWLQTWCGWEVRISW